MMKFELGLDKPDPARARASAVTIAGSGRHSWRQRARGRVAMTKCEACGKELVAGMQRFCGEECRDVFMERLKHGTRSATGRTAAKRRRKRGR
jgi:predicted nucleic acid-binding Zn ribbon protein